MGKNLKDFLNESIQVDRDQIDYYKFVLSHITDYDKKCITKSEIVDFINYKESLIYAGEMILKEL